MNLNNVITLLKNDLKSIGEDILLAKEPNENDTDIDTFITNRSHRTTAHLIANPPVPLVYTHKTRGFAYYLSQDGFIKPIDLYDAAFITDAAITWFASRAQESQFNPEIKILSQQDQAAHLIYKAVKKGKHKIARYEKIQTLTRNLELEILEEAILGLCRRQKENDRLTNNIMKAAQFFYAIEASSEEFESLLKQPSQSHAPLTHRITRKLNTIISALKHSYFVTQKRKNKALIICCMGVDGAGKSTTIKELAASAQKIDYVQTRMETKTQAHPLTKLYMKKLKGIFSFINSIFEKLKASKIGAFIENLEMRINLFFVHFDTKHKIRSLIKQSQNGKMVIVDRWWQDFFIAPKNKPIIKNNPALLNKFLSLPKPDLVILMEVPVEISLQRRAEENPNDLSYKKEQLSAFVTQHFADQLLNLKGNDKIDQNIKTIHHRLYQAWCDKISSQ